jgi:hypothetical protein
VIRRSIGWSIAAWSIRVLCACQVPDPPGDLVGAYHIDGELTDNTCGSDALPAADPLTFDVEIRKDKQGHGLWVRDTPPPRVGSLHSDGSFDFSVESAYDVPMTTSTATDTMFQQDPDPAKAADPEAIDRSETQAMQPCRLLVDETIHGTMLRVESATDAGTNADASTNADAGTGSDLTGENQIAIRAQAGSTCNRVLASQGGPFLALPCQAHYKLTGTLADSSKKQ